MNNAVAFLVIGIILFGGFLLFVDHFEIRFTTSGLFGNGDFKKETVSDEPFTGDVFWKKDTLRVYIEKTDSVDIDRIDAVKQSIFSDEKHAGNQYDGWSGAVKRLNQLHQNNAVPDRFIMVYDEMSSDVSILLTEKHGEEDDIGGVTGVKLRSDGEIIHSKITIFKADEYTPTIISSIARHEFGHALGLGHVQRSNDLMSESLKFTNIFIKERNILDLHEHYESLI